MPELSEAITAIREGAKEKDRFTYLTILQYNVTSPEVLPTVNEVLEKDPQLTQEIGWDLVQILLRIPGAETCLETVARLGNPREVMIKVMEALEQLSEESGDENALLAEAEEPEPPKDVAARFITLLGMLAILHRRIKTKYPSRFLGSSLVKVYEAYQPTPEMTASVINLVRSLSGRKRPPLPSRKSSINVANPDQDGDASKNAPDPEAEQEDPTEEMMQAKLLQAFVTCILQRYINENEMQWSARLLEKYYPEKNLPGRKTMTQKYTEDDTLQQRDAVVGQFVSILSDLGVDDCSQSFVKSIYEKASGFDPLANFENFDSADEIKLSPGGAVSVIAYWIFSAEVFEANHPSPEMHLFPEHNTLLERFLGADPQSEIVQNPGIADALVTVGLALNHMKLVSATQETKFMAYHHNLTLVSVFHPDLHVRNAATTYAGILLHSDPDDHNRLEILEDLLENCMFATLKAVAVTWLKEEILAANKEGASPNAFTGPEVVDHLQYFIFPDMQELKEMDHEALAEHWAQNNIFLSQVANFGYFLFSSGLKGVVPSGMGAAVAERFVDPLVGGAEKLQQGVPELGEGEKMELAILVDRLRSIPL
ncbi:YAP-binding/ALF4/Glomulin [Apiospora hydei]|uniref:YAP-binding/ALF4/Glomulin n=1 Tax=Apiospora hydei TaxID=1337664 RepID=A0ABR1X4Q2_9PEZI